MAACSAQARRHGVRADMPLAEAAALIEKVEDSHIEAHDPTADRQSLRQLAQWCEQFSPIVGMETGEEPSSLLLDVTGLGGLFGGESSLAGQVAEKFRRRGYAVRLAIADSIGAAWALAHFAETPAVVTDPGSSFEALGALPVEALRLPDATADLLNELGVHEIGQLSWLPRSSLSSRLGSELGRRLDQAQGLIEEIIAADRPTQEPEARWSLEHPTDDRRMLEQILARLVERVAEVLARQDRGALALECRLDGEGNTPVRISVGLYRPTAEPQHLMELVATQLERLMLPGPVSEVHVRATIGAPLTNRQHELFAAPAGHKPGQLAMLVDRLSSRLGRKCLVGAHLQADAQPERACRFVPLTGCDPKRRKSRPATRTDRLVPGPSERPLRIQTPPQAVHVVAVAPDGPPACFHYQNCRHRIVRHWGPERIETGWWRGRSVRRDYYRVETSTGCRFWLFRRQSDGKWFLQGSFE